MLVYFQGWTWAVLNTANNGGTLIKTALQKLHCKSPKLQVNEQYIQLRNGKKIIIRIIAVQTQYWNVIFEKKTNIKLVRSDFSGCVLIKIACENCWEPCHGQNIKWCTSQLQCAALLKIIAFFCFFSRQLLRLLRLRKKTTKMVAFCHCTFNTSKIIKWMFNNPTNHWFNFFYSFNLIQMLTVRGWKKNHLGGRTPSNLHTRLLPFYEPQ